MLTYLHLWGIWETILFLSSLSQADIQNVKDAICSAVDVMQGMASSICSLLTKVVLLSLFVIFLVLLVENLDLAIIQLSLFPYIVEFDVL